MASDNVVKHVSPHTAYSAFETTRNPEDGMSPISRWMGFFYDYADQSSSVVKCIIPPNSRVLRVAHEVHTAFAGVSAMIVGDGDNDDGWIVSGVITPTASDPEFKLDYDAAYSVVGKLYEDGDTIDVTFTGVATAGSGIVWVEVISYHEDADEEH